MTEMNLPEWAWILMIAIGWPLMALISAGLMRRIDRKFDLGFGCCEIPIENYLLWWPIYWILGASFVVLWQLEPAARAIGRASVTLVDVVAGDYQPTPQAPAEAKPDLPIPFGVGSLKEESE